MDKIESAKSELKREIAILDNTRKMYVKTMLEIIEKEGSSSPGVKMMQRMIDDIEINSREASIILKNEAMLGNDDFLGMVKNHFLANGFSTIWRHE